MGRNAALDKARTEADAIIYGAMPIKALFKGDPPNPPSSIDTPVMNFGIPGVVQSNTPTLTTEDLIKLNIKRQSLPVDHPAYKPVTISTFTPKPDVTYYADPSSSKVSAQKKDFPIALVAGVSIGVLGLLVVIKKAMKNKKR